MKIPVLYVALTVLIWLPATQSADPTCGEPHEIELASITSKTSEENPVGTTISYTCQFGYVADGTSRTSHCKLTEDGEDAEWTQPQMSCIPRSCGDPGFVTNGHRVGSLFTFSNSVIFKCDEGFRLVGKERRYCHASGSWSGTLPRCEGISCDPPNDPEHGHVTYNSLEFGSELKFKCDIGYLLNNLEPVTCTEDGTWSRTETICVEATCDFPQKPEHGSMKLTSSSGNPLSGTIVVFSCDGDRMPDGPTTSKCLDIGQWTFPAPKCLEPCNIPAVTNGRIGIYVKKGYNRNLVWTEISVGTDVDDNEKLFLHCNKGYSPLGSTDWQAKVTCSRGKWTDEPYCEPSPCRLDPPPVLNAIAEIRNSQHGITVYYSCSEDSRKVKSGNVKCQFGEWKGQTPICKDTRCSTDALTFHGVEKRGKQFYKSGEELQIVCNYGYSLNADHRGSIKCEDGVWEASFQPCVAGNCSNPPPSIAHGKPDIDVGAHGSVVRYSCEYPYVLEGYGKVQCQFGQWNGQHPKCEDRRCFTKDLRYSKGVSHDTDPGTNPGDRMNVRCIEGYTPRSSSPVCQTGGWTLNYESPCQEKECSVQWIPTARIKQQIVGRSKWDWNSFRFVPTVTFQNVPYGTIPWRGMSLFMFCNTGYNLQGTGKISVSIHCSEGRWSPDLTCILNGKTYVPSTRAVRVTSSINRVTTSTTRTTSQSPISRTAAPSPKVTKTSIPSEEEIENKVEMTPNSSTTTEEEIENDSCFCEYTLKDEKVVAYIDGTEIKFSDRVKDGSVVNFRCIDVGFHVLVGRRQVTCEKCQAWHSSDFPTCANPMAGDTVIIYNENVSISLDGALEVQKGQSVRLTCVGMEEAEFPVWKFPYEHGISVSNETMEREVGDVLYLSHLEIDNAGLENEGRYVCAVGTNIPTVVEFRVIDPNMRCPMIKDDEKLLVTYDMETRVGSQATFFCRNPGQILNGTSILTCMRNGEWSSNPSECIDRKCKKLEETDLMTVAYDDDRKIGSFAIFHCFAPGKRSGGARTKCLENGQWENTNSTCRAPPCSSDSLFSVLPRGVSADMKDVPNNTLPYKSTVRLVCNGNLIPVGNPVAKCEEDGKWEVDSVQCESSCSPLPRSYDSKLILKPVKDSYNFGEFLFFSCPPGLHLNPELHKMMCLHGTGWSENLLPECVDKIDLD